MSEVKKSSALLVLAAWLLVAIPAGWGVYKTAVNAMNLFRAPAASTPSH